MKPDSLDDLIGAYAKQPLPPAPDRVTTDVWREIDRRRARPFWSGLLSALNWREVLREPRLAFPALALAIAVGVLPAIAAHAVTRPQLARESLGFDVFSARSPGLPSTLLALNVVEHRTGVQR